MQHTLLAMLIGALGCLGYLRYQTVQAARQVRMLQQELRQLSQHDLVDPSTRRHLAMLASEPHETIENVGTTKWLEAARGAIDRAKGSACDLWDGWVDGLGPTTA
ncbi:MAG TPA: hypothetical protein VLA88_04900 [Candidatus Saccharimonadales bacterium]|nr:hypothetical protein [Candidatus Saccharimonadales bacterium]